jgi:hypothetical protein
MIRMTDEPKQRRSRAWIGWATIALLVLYPLSVGPAWWVCFRLCESPSAALAFGRVYAPFVRAVNSGDSTLGRIVVWYIGLWMDVPGP